MQIGKRGISHQSTLPSSQMLLKNDSCIVWLRTDADDRALMVVVLIAGSTP